METTRQKAYLDAEKIEPKHRTLGCSLHTVACMCIRSIWFRLHGKVVGRDERRVPFMLCHVQTPL